MDDTAKFRDRVARGLVDCPAGWVGSGGVGSVMGPKFLFSVGWVKS